MLSKKSFLKKIKKKVREKAVEIWNFSYNFCISKKLIDRFIEQIFDYLSLKKVYINVNDPDIYDTLIKDLNEMITSYINHFGSFIFLNNFKSSDRQIQNDEREKLMKFHETIDFNKYKKILKTIHRNHSNRGRSTIQ